MSSTSSYCECAKASFAYLIGETHCSQESHAGIVSVFAKVPPNKIIGIVNTGGIVVAVFTLGAKEEIRRPIPMAV